MSESLATPKKRPESLSGKQKKQLRALAHHLSATVTVGKDGITPALLLAVSAALDNHELIKVRVLSGAPISRDAATAALAEPLGAHVAGALGRIIMLYRRHPSDPQIGI